MNRRQFIRTTGTAAAAVLTNRAWSKDAPGKQPNILLIFSDQQHWQAMGFVDSFFETPHLDALAKQSVVFDRSFCTTPQCSPSRSSLLTGFYPSTTGVFGNVGAAGGKSLTRPTIATELKSAGYRTGYFGKWHLGSNKTACAGWDRSAFKTNDAVAESGALAFLKDPETQNKRFALFVSVNNPHDIYHFQKHRLGKTDVPLPKSWEAETFKNKPPIQQQFMNEDQGKAIVGKTKKEWQKYRDCYRDKNRLYDNIVGKILEELKKQGQWENTIIIVTSDHGDMDTQHKLIFKGPFLYEHMVRIPLIIRLPKAFGGIGTKRIADIDVVNVDIVPTLRALCGLPEKPSQGKSLKPLLSGTGQYTPREFVVVEYYSKQRWVNPIRMIRTKRFKLNRHIHWGDEMYDLEKDPHELTNVAEDPQYAEAKKTLIEKLDRWIKEQNDPFYSQKVSTRRGRAPGS